ncbi:APC5 protein, partial [Coemansia sp. RSA 2599]
MNGGANGSGYLSASKLALLVCIEQYSRNYDWGPATLSDLGQFLVLRLYGATTAWADNGWHDLRASLSAIHVHALDKPLLAVVTSRLASLQTLDALHTFFDGIAKLVVDAESHMEPDNDAVLLDSESVFGIFIRRCFLAFGQLEFYQITRFYAECRQMALVLEGRGDVEVTEHSQKELQEHVEALIGRLEEESRTPVPGQMEKMIRTALDRLPGYSRIHYLRYLDLVRRGESSQSEASLRRFFDSNAVKDNRTIYQYALLYLAAMRVQLGMVDGARQALTEATHVARDCQDHVCLLYIVCWECRLLFDMLQASRDARTEAALRQSLSALVAKASSMHNHELEAAGRLLQTDLLVATGAQPADVFESLVRVRALIIEHDVGKLRAAWYLTAARAWMCHEAPMWTAMLHTRMAGRDADALTERELTEATRQMALAQATLSGPLAAAHQLETQIGLLALIDPARQDSLNDTLGLLRLSAGHSEQEENGLSAGLGPAACADSSVRRLDEARSLIADGYVCEARELLLSIAEKSQPPTTRTTASERAAGAATRHIRQSEPAAV